MIQFGTAVHYLTVNASSALYSVVHSLHNVNVSSALYSVVHSLHNVNVNASSAVYSVVHSLHNAPQNTYFDTYFAPNRWHCMLMKTNIKALIINFKQTMLL